MTQFILWTRHAGKSTTRLVTNGATFLRRLDGGMSVTLLHVFFLTVG
jgi:hypothetical protein